MSRTCFHLSVCRRDLQPPLRLCCRAAATLASFQPSLKWRDSFVHGDRPESEDPEAVRIPAAQEEKACLDLQARLGSVWVVAPRRIHDDRENVTAGIRVQSVWIGLGNSGGEKKKRKHILSHLFSTTFRKGRR